MSARFGRVTACDNMNHRRATAPVSHCPKCGGVVNERIAVKSCSETAHAAARLRHSTFCVDCGARLIAAR